MNHSPAPPQLYSVKDTCRRLGIGKSLLYVLIGEQQITPARIAGRTLFSETELQRYITASMKGTE